MIKLQIHNTMGNKKELFIPKDKKNVRIYACGPTVYNYAHIGNARMAVVCDLLVRVLKEIYPSVTYVSNITDIDDKIIDSAIKNKITITELTNKFSKIYNQDMKALGVNLPDIQPKATDYIEEIINLISKLLKNDYAYFTNKHYQEEHKRTKYQEAESKFNHLKKTQVILYSGNPARMISQAGVLLGAKEDLDGT